MKVLEREQHCTFWQRGSLFYCLHRAGLKEFFAPWRLELVAGLTMYCIRFSGFDSPRLPTVSSYGLTSHWYTRSLPCFVPSSCTISCDNEVVADLVGVLLDSDVSI